MRANRPNIPRVTEQPVSDNNAKRPAASVSPFGTSIRQGIQLRYSDLPQITRQIETEIKQEEGETHADEIETSMMLFIAPSTVDITKAVKDFHPSPKDGLTRNPQSQGAYSASGVYGDATLATQEKGELLVRIATAGILKEVEEFRRGN